MIWGGVIHLCECSWKSVGCGRHLHWTSFQRDSHSQVFSLSLSLSFIFLSLSFFYIYFSLFFLLYFFLSLYIYLTHQSGRGHVFDMPEFWSSLYIYLYLCVFNSDRERYVYNEIYIYKWLTEWISAILMHFRNHS